MKTEIDLLASIRGKSKRDYLARVNEFPKAEAAKKALQFGYDYWDGDRKFGYGGFKYDGRWRSVADAMVKHYGLKDGDRVLDVGCGKAFLLYDLTQAVPGLEVTGIDISAYAIEHAKPEMKPSLRVCSAAKLPFPAKSFDFVFSLNTLNCLYNYELASALKEIERVGRRDKYICVESYRTEEEKANFLFWQLTTRTFCTPEEWRWWYKTFGYTGDYSFGYFE
jgi:protein-L-isoaspartate(D-aspartate) O-methyltransferase